MKQISGPRPEPKRKPMRKRSAAKGRWHRIYLAALVWCIRQNPLCRICDINRACQGHHPWGQIGALIMLFIPICQRCHNFIHDNSRFSKSIGLLFT